MSSKKENKKNKFNFAEKKDYTIRSLKEVNYFLCNLDKTIRYIKLYRLFK